MHSLSLYAGIDIAKLKHDVGVINDQKKIVTPCFVIQESAEGYKLLLDRLQNIQQRTEASQIYVGMEATSEYWRNLYHFLLRNTTWHVTVINPVQTSHFIKSNLRRARTDPAAALDIALYMRERKPAPTMPQESYLQIIKDIDSQITGMMKDRNASIYRLRLELAKTFPELERSTSSMTSQRLLALLVRYSTAESIRNASSEELSELTTGPKGRRIPLSFVNSVKALAQNSIASKTGQDAGIVGQSLAKRLEEMQLHIISLKKELIRVYQDNVQTQSILTTIPGIAPMTAAILEAYIGDVNRFSGYKKICAYFGLNPSVTISGQYIGKSRLQKKGNAKVRKLLFMNTLSMIRFKIDPIYSFYKRKVDEGKPKMVAVAAAMRKLLVIIYTMLKKNENFEPKK